MWLLIGIQPDFAIVVSHVLRRALGDYFVRSGVMHNIVVL